MTLEELLRSNPNREFLLRTTGVNPDRVRIELAPEEQTFEVFSYYVIGNELFPVVDLDGEATV
jgi:hypothetical protein